MNKNLFFATLILFVACAPQQAKAAQNHIAFDPNTYYSQLIINSNLYHFHCNTGKVGGLGRYDASTGTVSTGEYVSSRKFDYVNGLVFKATLEAIQQHYNTEGLREDAYSWFKSVEEFGNRYYNDGRNGESLDDLNACKLYFGLYDITKAGGLGLVDGRNYENSTTASNCQTAKGKALSGLSTHNSTYSISSSTSNTFCGNSSTYEGGWWHKRTYENQLWLDGQYMGPALLAMMVADGRYISGSAAGDWAIIRKQFDMCWNRLWDSEKKLLYHAFSANPTSSQTTKWADHTDTYATNPHYGVSSEFWGRAAGWYFFALVDILEQMDKVGKNDADYVEFKRQLEAVADGLLARQDPTTGCWCQLLQYGNGVVPAGCSTANYLESSASAIFTATFLKGMRLGYLSKSKYEVAAKKAYKGFVEQFIVKNTGGEDGGNAYSIIKCCASAGLSSDRDGSAKYYLAENSNKDTQVINTYTEGKVLGAFILAAVEYELAYPPAAEPAGGECRCLRVNITE